MRFARTRAPRGALYIIPERPHARSPSDVVFLRAPCSFSRYVGYRKEVLKELDEEAEHLTPASFTPLRWLPEDEREYDDFVCCTECSRWYHFVCALYPAPEQCPRAWRLEAQAFVCHACLPAAPPKGKLAAQRGKLFALQARRAADLPTCAMSAAVEEHLQAELAAKGVSTPTPLVVRVVSRKRFIFPAEQALKERYGAAYAAEFRASRPAWTLRPEP